MLGGLTKRASMAGCLTGYIGYMGILSGLYKSTGHSSRLPRETYWGLSAAAEGHEEPSVSVVWLPLRWMQRSPKDLKGNYYSAQNCFDEHRALG